MNVTHLHTGSAWPKISLNGDGVFNSYPLLTPSGQVLGFTNQRPANLAGFGDPTVVTGIDSDAAKKVLTGLAIGVGALLLAAVALYGYMGYYVGKKATGSHWGWLWAMGGVPGLAALKLYKRSKAGLPALPKTAKANRRRRHRRNPELDLKTRGYSQEQINAVKQLSDDLYQTFLVMSKKAHRRRVKRARRT